MREIVVAVVSSEIVGLSTLELCGRLLSADARMNSAFAHRKGALGVDHGLEIITRYTTSVAAVLDAWIRFKSTRNHNAFDDELRNLLAALESMLCEVG